MRIRPKCKLVAVHASCALYSTQDKIFEMASHTGQIGMNTVMGVNLSQNPSYTHTWRDASLTGPKVALMFAADTPVSPPWTPETKLQFQSPDKYASQVRNSTLVHTGGCTDMAHHTHHAANATCMSGTLYRGLQNDAAYQEQSAVAQQMMPYLDALLEACSRYHSHSQDGWITSAGFVVCAHKAGIHLTRSQFLALERSVPKDTLGRINYHAVIATVQSLAASHGLEGHQDGFSIDTSYDSTA